MEQSIRKPTRLREYDYSTNGAYFVTVCSKDRQHLFGSVERRICDDASAVGRGLVPVFHPHPCRKNVTGHMPVKIRWRPGWFPKEGRLDEPLLGRSLVTFWRNRKSPVGDIIRREQAPALRTFTEKPPRRKAKLLFSILNISFHSLKQACRNMFKTIFHIYPCLKP